MVIKQDKRRVWYIWIMAGIILASVLGAMSASGSYNPNQLFDHGNIYEFSRTSLNMQSKTCSFDEESGIFTVLTDSAKKRFAKVPVKQWAYIDFEIDKLNAPGAAWNLLYLDRDKNIIAQQPIGVVNGKNTVQIACGEKFRYLYLQILNQPGLQFSLKKVQVRIGDAVSFLDWLRPFIGYVMIYLLASAIWCLLREKNRDALTAVLQYAFIRIGDSSGRKLTERLGEQQREHLRTALFAILFLGMAAANALGIYSTDAGYRYCLIFVTVILLGIAFLLWEKPLHYVKWKGDVAFFWFFYWGTVCVMDFLADKHFRYTGYACLAGMLPLIFIWNQCQKPARLWRNMIHALEIVFPLVMLYCMVFRGKRIGVLYNGIFTNREDMAIYSVTMLGIFLLALVKLSIQNKEKRKKWDTLRFLAAVSAVSLCVHNLYLSWTPVCIAVGGILLCCFLVLLMIMRKQLPGGIAPTVLRLLAAAFCSLLIVVPVHWCMNELPYRLGTDVEFQQDILESYVPADVMKLAEQTNPGMYDGVRCIEKEEKILIWRSYIREIDLLGNKPVRRVAKHKTMAASGWLELMYRYGVFILLPFMGLWGAVLARSIRKRSFTLCLLFIGYHMLFFTQNIEKPFLQPLWILVYLGTGCLMQEEI